MKARFILLTLTLVAGCNEESPHTPAARQTPPQTPQVRELDGPFFGVNLGESIKDLAARYTLTRMDTDDPNDPREKWSVHTGDADLQRLEVKALDGVVYAISASLRGDPIPVADTITERLRVKYGQHEITMPYNNYVWKAQRGGNRVKIIMYKFPLHVSVECIDVRMEDEAMRRAKAATAANLEGHL